MSKSILKSKILVCDVDQHSLVLLKDFFEKKGLIGLLSNSDSLEALLLKNVDLGAIFISRNFFESDSKCYDFVCYIHKVRPELPIFFREDYDGESSDLSVCSKIASAYNVSRLETLERDVNNHIFSSSYPIELIRGIQEVAKESIETIILESSAECEKVYLVKDNIIYGELFSLIPIESDWGRGYMMLQAKNCSIIDVIRNGQTALEISEPNFRDVNELLGEVTNLIWGKIKSRYIKAVSSVTNIQVPILVNHVEKYISFGSKESQLCFEYLVGDNGGVYEPIVIYMRLVFNLSYDPQRFLESSSYVDELINCGELEFF